VKSSYARFVCDVSNSYNEGLWQFFELFIRNKTFFPSISWKYCKKITYLAASGEKKVPENYLTMMMKTLTD